MPRPLNIESVFVGLRRAWYPPSAAIEASFTRLTRALAEIYTQLGSDPDLAQVHEELYKDFPGLTSAPPAEPAADRRGRIAAATGRIGRRHRPRLPLRGDRRAERRRQSDRRAAAADTTVKSFYLCNSLIQLMEDVYLDLQLEQEYRHPDNRGWMNLFRHWSESDTMRKAWAVSAPTYGSRFQEFCRRRFGLTLGTPDLVSLWDARYAEGGPLEKGPATAALESAERRVIDLLTRSHRRGERNPVAERVRQVVLCRLRVPTARAFAHPGPDRDELTVPYGIAVISGDRTDAPDLDREPSDSRDDDGRLLTLRVRRHLRDQGLGRQLMGDLVRRMGVRWTDPPSAEELRFLGLAPDSGKRIESMFKSVINEISLGEQPVNAPVDNPVFGQLPRLPYSGVVRPRDATWAHAVGFIFWILAWTDGAVGDAESDAVLEALRVWAGERVEPEEIEFAVDESRDWYLTAKRPVTALWPEVRAIVGALREQPWFGVARARRFRAGLDRIARADDDYSDDEAKLIRAIEEWLVPDERRGGEPHGDHRPGPSSH